MSALEQTETLATEVPVRFRRLGYGRVHFALVMPESITPGEHWGAACEWLADPVAAWCGRVLRGRLVVIPQEYLHTWQRNGSVCRECQLIARQALKRASGHGIVNGL